MLNELSGRGGGTGGLRAFGNDRNRERIRGGFSNSPPVLAIKNETEHTRIHQRHLNQGTGWPRQSTTRLGKDYRKLHKKSTLSEEITRGERPLPAKDIGREYDISRQIMECTRFTVECSVLTLLSLIRRRGLSRGGKQSNQLCPQIIMTLGRGWERSCNRIWEQPRKGNPLNRDPIG